LPLAASLFLLLSDDDISMYSFSCLIFWGERTLRVTSLLQSNQFSGSPTSTGSAGLVRSFLLPVYYACVVRLCQWLYIVLQMSRQCQQCLAESIVLDDIITKRFRTARGLVQKFRPPEVLSGFLNLTEFNNTAKVFIF
jgi:hypothetical protein